MGQQPLAVVTAAALTAALIVTASAGGAGAGVGTTGTSKESTCSAKRSAKGVAAAFNQFLTTATAAEKVTFIEQGAKIQGSVEKSNGAAIASGTTKPTQQTLATNVRIACAGKAKATFTYDLQFRDAATNTTTPPLRSAPGRRRAPQAGGLVRLGGHGL